MIPVRMAGAVIVVVAGLVVGQVARARGTDSETRDFSVQVDGKATGEAHMTIHKQEEGTTVVVCDTDILVKLLVGHYKYSFRGQEQWKEGRLLRLDSTCNDDGKLFRVEAVAEGNNLRLKVNNQDKTIRGDVWLTSYWSEPTTKANQDVGLLDADSGKEMSARVQLVGVEARTVAGQGINATHYRLTGKQGTTDLWYDGNNRLVRQEWLEDGRKVVMELIRLRR
jgi:hypothetical protein